MNSPFSVPWGHGRSRQCWGAFADVPSNGIQAVCLLLLCIQAVCLLLPLLLPLQLFDTLGISLISASCANPAQFAIMSSVRRVSSSSALSSGLASGEGLIHIHDSFSPNLPGGKTLQPEWVSGFIDGEGCFNFSITILESQ
jgi:hypothetical protein